MICSHLMKQPVKFATESCHLNNLQLANDGDTELLPEMDVSVGTDFYWHIVLGNVVWGESGPVAMEMKLVCVLSGPVRDGGVDTASSINLISTHLLMAETITSSNKCVLREDLNRFWDLDITRICFGKGYGTQAFSQWSQVQEWAL